MPLEMNQQEHIAVAVCVLYHFYSSQLIYKVSKHTALHLCLQEVNRESTLRHAEGADLRSALREAQSKRAVPEALATLHAELAHLRSTHLLCCHNRDVVAFAGLAVQRY